MIPSRQQAAQIVDRYNQQDFHRRHAQIVAGVLAWFAGQYDPERVDYWYVTGLLHDVDFEQYPEEHCVRGIQILEAEGVEGSIIRSAMSHGWGMTGSPYAPESTMEKILFAIDELTGLIGAVALMRPSGSVQDLEVKSVLKKFKQPSFAAGVSRETISTGAKMLGWSLDELIGQTILALRSLDYVD